MSLLSLTLLGAGLHAGPHVLSISEEIRPAVTGGWARVLPDGDEDWLLLFAAGGDLNVLPMSAEFEVVDVGRRSLTGRDDLEDHNLQPCPGGGYLHTASCSLQRSNDSAWAFRYDDALDLTSEVTIAEASPQVMHNDMPLHCGDDAAWTAFVDDPTGSVVLLELDTAGAERRRVLLDVRPHPEGGSLLRDPLTGHLALIGADDFGTQLEVQRHDDDLQPVERFPILYAPKGHKYFWPQALLVVEDRMVLAYMHQDEQNWGSDWGDVRLAIFDLEWKLLEEHAVSAYPSPEGGQRPGLAVRDDVLVLSLDAIEGSPGTVTPRLFEIRLDLDAFRDPEDTGTPPDTGDSGDTQGERDSGDTTEAGTDTPPVPPRATGCGCGSGSLTGLVVLLGLRRRSRVGAVERREGLGDGLGGSQGTGGEERS